MKGAWWQRYILAIGDVALRDIERVKGLKIQFIHVRLIWRRSELLPEHPCCLFRGVLDEIVPPYFPWNHARVIRACLCKLIEELNKETGQIIVDALTVFKDEGVSEDQPLDPIGKVFRHLADHRPAKAMTDQDHIVQVAAPDVRDDGVDAIPVCNPSALICWAMTNECWGVGMVPFCLEMANDSLPCKLQNFMAANFYNYLT